MSLWDIVREVTGSARVPVEEQCRDGDIYETDEPGRTQLVECEARAMWMATASHKDEPSITVQWPLCGQHLADAMEHDTVLVHDVRWIGGDPA